MNGETAVAGLALRPRLARLALCYGAVVAVLAWAKWAAPVSSDTLIEPVWDGTSSSPFHGALWILESACWLVAAFAGLVAAWRARRRGAGGEERFFLCTSGLSALFLVDDVAQLHKPLLQDWVGIPQTVVLGGYLVVGAIWLWFARGHLRATDRPVLFVTLACFGVWLCCKALPYFAMQNSIQIAVKLGGAAGWVFFVVSVALGARREAAPGDRPRGR